jgi:hypothetical protein
MEGSGLIQCFPISGTRALRGTRDNSEGYVNTSEMSAFLFLCPFALP